MKTKDLKVGEEYAAKSGRYGTASRVKVISTVPQVRWVRGEWAWSLHLHKSPQSGVLVEIIGSEYGQVSLGDGFEHREQGRKLRQAIIPPGMIRRTWAEQEARRQATEENDARLAAERAAREIRVSALLSVLHKVGLKSAAEDSFGRVRISLEEAEALVSKLRYVQDHEALP